MQVWVYPEKQYEEFGAVRWAISWEEIRLGAPTDDDFDHDRDIIHKSRAFKTWAAAHRAARKLVDSYSTAYGQVTLTKQAVDWYVEEDRVAEWSDVGEPEYID